VRRLVDAACRHVALLSAEGREDEGAEVLDSLAPEDAGDAPWVARDLGLTTPVAAAARRSTGRRDLYSWAVATAREGMLRDMAVERTISTAASALAGNGHEFVLLKGAWSRDALYPSTWLRRMVDVDILVRPADKAAAIHCLQVAGFGLVEDDPRRPISGRWAREARFRGIQGGVPVELHWGPLNEYGGFRWDFERLLDRGRPARWPGARAMSLEDNLAHTAIHLARGGFSRRHMTQLLDLTLIAGTRTLDMDALEEYARQQGCRIALDLALQVAGREFGCRPLPRSETAGLQRSLAHLAALKVPSVIAAGRESIPFPAVPLLMDRMADAALFMGWLAVTRTLDGLRLSLSRRVKPTQRP
jgi:hypothetical protein